MSQSLADVTGSSQARPGTRLRGQAGSKATMRKPCSGGILGCRPSCSTRGLPAPSILEELEKSGDQAKLGKEPDQKGAGATWPVGNRAVHQVRI